MSFGKRQHRENIDPPKPSNEFVRSLRAHAAGEVGAMLAGLVIGAAILFSGYFFLTQAGKGLDQRWASTPVDDAVGNDDIITTVGNQALSEVCPAPQRKIGYAMQSHSIHFHTQRDYIEAPFNRIALEEGEIAFEMAEYLTCMMLIDEARYCKPSAREDLAFKLKTYLGLRRSARELLWDRARFDEAVVIYDKKVKSLPQLSLWERRKHNAAMELYQVNAELSSALNRLAERGYVTARDFGGFLGLFVPEEVQEIIGNVNLDQGACS